MVSTGRNTIDFEYIKSVYRFIKENLRTTDRAKYLERIATYWLAFQVVFSDLSFLQEQDCDYINPYIDVKKGSRVVIYGAGRVGESIVKAVGVVKMDVVAVVDSNKEIRQCCGYDVVGVEKLKNLTYDYVLVAVGYVETAYEIKKILVNSDVEEKKIAIMNVSGLEKLFED